MSLQNRKKAVDIIVEGIVRAHPGSTGNDYVVVASHILNGLLKAGFLNDSVIVYAEEVKDELDKAVFKCKAEE